MLGPPGALLYAGPGTPGRYNLFSGCHTAYGVGSPHAEYPTNMEGAPVKIRLCNDFPVSLAKPMNAFFNTVFEVASSLAFYPGGHPRVCF